MYSLIGRPISDYINENPLYLDSGYAIIPYRTVVYLGKMLMNIIGTTKDGYICCLPYRSIESAFFDSHGISYGSSNIRKKIKQFTTVYYSNVLRKLVPVQIDDCPKAQEYGFVMNEAEADAIKWQLVPEHPQVFWTRTCGENDSMLYLMVGQDNVYKCYGKPSKILIGCRPIFFLNTEHSFTLTNDQLFM